MLLFSAPSPEKYNSLGRSGTFYGAEKSGMCKIVTFM